MPVFNINVRTNSHNGGTATVQKNDPTELRNEMARFVGELLRDHASEIWIDQDWQIDVTGEDGLILYVLNVSAFESAAVSCAFSPQ